MVLDASCGWAQRQPCDGQNESEVDLRCGNNEVVSPIVLNKRMQYFVARGGDVMHGGQGLGRVNTCVCWRGWGGATHVHTLRILLKRKLSP